MVMNRTDIPEGVKADLHKWGYENLDKHYKAYSPLHKQGLCELMPLKGKVKGEYFKETTAISIDSVPEKVENEGLSEAVPVEGFSPIIAVRRRSVMIPISYEAKRDFTRSVNFLEDFIKINASPLYAKVVDQEILTDMFNYGGYTSGNAIFNNNTPGQEDISGDGVYDGTAASPIPFMTRNGSNRTPKGHTTTYYNAIARNLSYDYLVEADTLLKYTNAKMEDGTPFMNTEGLILMVHGSNDINAQKLIKSSLTPDDANTAYNALSNGYRIVVNPFLRTAASWAIGRAGFGIKLFLDPYVVRMWYDEENEEFKASIGWNYACGVMNFRFCVGSQFPTSA